MEIYSNCVNTRQTTWLPRPLRPLLPLLPLLMSRCLWLNKCLDCLDCVMSSVWRQKQLSTASFAHTLPPSIAKQLLVAEGGGSSAKTGGVLHVNM